MHQKLCLIALEIPPDFLLKDPIVYTILTLLLLTEHLMFQDISINLDHRIDRRVIYLVVALR